MVTEDPVYETRRAQPFAPTSVRFSDIQAAIPPQLRLKKLSRSLTYVARDLVFSVILFYAVSFINSEVLLKKPFWIRGFIWVFYWYWQSIAWTGFWCLGMSLCFAYSESRRNCYLAHEAGHGNLSEHYQANYTIGFVLHSFLLVPHFAWRYTHYIHHVRSHYLPPHILC